MDEIIAEIALVPKVLGTDSKVADGYNKTVLHVGRDAGRDRSLDCRHN